MIRLLSLLLVSGLVLACSAEPTITDGLQKTIDSGGETGGGAVVFADTHNDADEDAPELEFDVPGQTTGQTTGGTTGGTTGATDAGDAGETPTDLGSEEDTGPLCVPGSSCTEVNQFGTCHGLTACSDTGVPSCMAMIPSEEICNQIDDNCNGLVDEGEVCGPEGCPDGSACEPGDSDAQNEACGKCGERSRVRDCTDDCAWGPWGDWTACAGGGTCTPGEKETQTEGCGNCGKKTRTRTCDNSCGWSGWSAWSGCGGQGACSPGAKTAGGCDACSEKTCNSQCNWAGCKLKAGSECEWEEGSNWKCCGSGKWHFCLPPVYGCKWSSQCAACTGCGC